MESFLYPAFCRRLPWSCLAAVAGLFVVASVNGQATVTVTAGQTMSLRTGVSTATFSDVNPLVNIGTTYTYASGGTNGSATFSGLTAGTAVTPGSFVSGSASGYATPDANSGTYLAIGGTGRPGPISLTFSNASTNYLGLEWASPDSYNSVKLTFKDGTSTTYTPGSFALATSASNSFVEFASSQPIIGVSLASSMAAFELDNVAFGVVAVPEPATWMAGGLILLSGVVVVRRRRMPSK